VNEGFSPFLMIRMIRMIRMIWMIWMIRFSTVHHTAFVRRTASE
jgi:hypothetical protein